jgi:hypothetical protein
MFSKFKWTLALTVLSAGWAFCNQVTNPGFETGDFTGWTLSGDPICVGVVPAGSSSFVVGSTICGGLGNSIVHSGNSAAYLGSQNSDGMLSQTVATIPGATYDINFWLASLNLGTNIPNDFSVLWGGTTLASSTNVAPSAFTDFDYHATAVGSAMTLTFRSRNEFSYFVLDDVSVTQVGTAVPEPGDMVLTAALLAFALADRLRKRRARRTS